MALPLFKSGIPTMGGRSVPVMPKKAQSIYQTPEFKAWRAAVIDRAGGRCEFVDNGIRCHKQAPQHRMFADHKQELKDGGAPFDIENGQCLCGAHHSAKTARARADRRFR